MSREFGSCNSGFLWQQIETATTDCEDGGGELTRAFSCLFKSLEYPTYALCSAEEGDWSHESFARAVLGNIENVKAQLEHVERTARTIIEGSSDARNIASALAKLTLAEIDALGVSHLHRLGKIDPNGSSFGSDP